MQSIIGITLKGVYRDRVFHGILMAGLVFLLIPSISSLSMRQTTELAVTLSLSLISLLLLMVTVFLAATAIWRDIERRYVHAVLSLPLSRSSYLLGKYCGVGSVILAVAAVMGVVSCLAIDQAAEIYAPYRPVQWPTVCAAIFFDALKYLLLASCGFLLSTVSTSFFLPIFGTICIYITGAMSQQVSDYLNSPASRALPPLLKKTVGVLYYVVPNLGAFDLKAQAIYSIPLDVNGLLFTLIYWVAYTGVILSLACLAFAGREMK